LAAPGGPYHGQEARVFQFFEYLINLLLATEENIRLVAAEGT